jgi:hypothetical protein
MGCIDSGGEQWAVDVENRQYMLKKGGTCSNQAVEVKDG